MGFQTKKVKFIFFKTLKQNITILEFEIKLFSHFLVAFLNQKDILDN
jgi:hypothetical protein